MSKYEIEPLTHLLEYLFDEIEEGEKLSYIDVQKIFFLTREKLDDDNRIVDLLPVYWYVHGPMSKAVSHALFDAKEKGVIAGTATYSRGAAGGVGQSYVQGEQDAPEVEYDADLRAAESTISTVLEEYYESDDSLSERLEDQVYSTHAPFEFQTYYKFEVQPSITRFARNPTPLTEPPSEIAFRLARAEGKFPSDPGFEECRRAFSRFVSLSETYLDSVDESEKPLAEDFVELADLAWEVFARNLRVHYHDDSYEDNRPDWERKFREGLEDFDLQLRRFENEMKQKDIAEPNRDTGSDPVGVDSAWGRVASSLLEDTD
ncbi:hypothetical protein [Halosimplex halobium]|uniref:hypothetical protein n=1 Tax=Halosimplex halobium TaxID=3396618 RepID=UPI003F56B4B6